MIIMALEAWQSQLWVTSHPSRHVARPLQKSLPQTWGATPCLGSSHAHPVSILLEFLEDPPESGEGGLPHAEHRKPTPHLPEVGGPTALHGAQHIHLLSNISHQEVASLAGEETRDGGSLKMAQGHLLQPCPRPQRIRNRETGQGTWSSSCLQTFGKDKQNT